MTKPLLKLFACLLLLAALRMPAAAQAPAHTVTVAAAADLKFALEELKQEFARQQPSIALKLVYGSSGNFYTQLVNRAPFDLFLSADMEYPQKLAEQGLTVRGSEFTYAVGRLVLWGPTASRLDVQKLGMKALLDPSIHKIAIGNPAHAPYGRAAVAAMQSSGVYPQAQPKLVFGENIAQAAQYVASGAADAGLIALSLAIAPEMSSRGHYWELPLSSYPHMDQGGVILAASQEQAAAAQFRTFLMSARGHEILKKYGFYMPGEKR